MKVKKTRRDFLKTGAIGLAGITVVPNIVMGKGTGFSSRVSPSDKLNIAEGADGKVINVASFGAIPDDGKDQTEALRKAVQACRETHASQLVFAPGQYQISDPDAIKLQDDAIHGRMGKSGHELQDRIFNKGFRYVSGLDFSGIRDLTIDARGAELLCDGWMEPVSLVNTTNVTLRGLAIDYRRPPNSAGRVIRVGDGNADVVFPDWCPVVEGMLYPRTLDYDKSSDSYVRDASFDVDRAKLIAPQTLRMPVRGDVRVGHIFCGIHSWHFRPAILIYQSLNTTLEDVSIFAQPGMGIVGHLSENILLKRVRVCPKTQDRYISCNTDATHFATCYGDLVVEDCEFAGQTDDAINVHTYYQTILSHQSQNCRMMLDRPFETHSVKPDVPRPGDQLAITERETLKEVGRITVTRINEVNPKTYEIDFDFSGDLPEDYGKYVLANVSGLPRLTFRNCQVRAHLARSVLVKTRSVLIEGNHFDGSTGTAINIAAEGNWLEGVTSADVIVRGNEFSRNGGGAGTIGDAAVLAININVKRRDILVLHKRILIEDNTIRQPEARYVFSIQDAADVTIRNNILIDAPADALQVSNSVRVHASGNRGMSDFSTGDGEPSLPHPSAMKS
jgi:hypothetical protein